MHERRRWRRLLVLAGLLTAAAALYGVRPAAGGLANWQESVRAVVSRQMQRTGDLVVPGVYDELYLNKPPLLNWLTVLVAELRGVEVGLTDLRLVLAVAGVCALAVTFVIARRLFAGDAARDPIALWAVALTGTGVLVTRSSRLGEIDGLLMPLAIGAVGAMLLAWRRAEEKGRLSIGLIAVASICCALATLAKGPPPLAAIALGGVVAPAIVSARRSVVGPAQGRARVLWSMVGAVALGALGVGNVSSLDGAFGLVVYVGLGALLGGWLADLGRPSALAAWAKPLWLTQPWIPLGAGALAVWGWLAAASARIGDEAVSAVVESQAETNLVLFEPIAAFRNLGFAAYGVGLGSVFAFAAIVYIARERRPVARSAAVLAVWCVLALALFSVFGKGVARYLTPMWPAIGLLGAWWLVTMLRTNSSLGRPLRVVSVAAVLLLFLGQLWWFGFGRDTFPQAHQRRLVAQSIEAHGFAPGRVVATPAELMSLSFYLDTPVEHWRNRDAEQRWRELGERLAGERAVRALGDTAGAGAGVPWLIVTPADRADAVRRLAASAGVTLREIEMRAAEYRAFEAHAAAGRETMPAGRTPAEASGGDRVDREPSDQ